ncbi:MAG: hypothetical protein KDA75_12350 [Planctomycetaceae bacterium]|nr:hypothetical protein [Planctomycetaceae bacterium]
MPSVSQTSGTDATRRQRRRVLCLLLAICLWRGPVPLCHLHADSAETSDLAGPSLAWHLQWFHGGAFAPSESLGWHWHFVVPGDSDGDGQRDAESAEVLSGSQSASKLSNAHSLQMLSDLLALAVDSSACLNVTNVAGDSGRPRPRAVDDPPQYRCGPDVRLLAGVALC